MTNGNGLICSLASGARSDGGTLQSFTPKINAVREREDGYQPSPDCVIEFPVRSGLGTDCSDFARVSPLTHRLTHKIQGESLLKRINAGKNSSRASFPFPPYLSLKVLVIS